MDAYTRRMVNDAYAMDDEARRRSEDFEFKMQQRAAPREVLYRVQEDALVEQQIPSISKEDVLQLIDSLADEAGSTCGRLEKEINTLRERILKLEITNEVLRSFITTKVATLTSIKGKSSDAA